MPCTHLLRYVCLLLLIPLLLHSAPVLGKTDPARLVSHGGYAVTAGGTVVGSYNKDASFAPASTIKIVTSLAALQILGPDYRFSTDFYLDRDDNLYIKGSGDPSLTSEAVAVIALALRQRGLQQVGGIILDASAFAVKDAADGTENSANPYDTLNSALAVNFNSLPIKVLADHSVVSGEEETPLLPIMQEIGAQLAPGTYRVNPAAFQLKSRLPATLRYTGELFRAMLAAQGVTVTSGITTGRVPAGLKVIYRHVSDKTVEDLVRSCLHYSNNFLANQLFLACGAKLLAGPADWTKGRKAMRTFIDATWPEFSRAIIMVEGSGLSRKDRITPAAMLAVLETFRPYADLLKTRDGVPLKSGSLSGVHCYAGYFNQGERKDPFVILLNQQDNTRDRILAMLRTLHAARL
jgi:serine-type D-Ala-D-Ala carboxypeptidase/endopeptidase (penicillin-binding protein 4)